MATVHGRGVGLSGVKFPGEGYSVWTKQNWSDAWAYQPFLFPEHSTEAAWPSESEATLIWEFGTYKVMWNTPYAYLTPINIDNFYIQILTHTAYGTYISWIGVVVSSALVEEGVNQDTGIPAGVQTIQCKGLEYLIDRRVVNYTYADDGTGTAIKLGSTRPFNRRHRRGASVQGNRSDDLGNDGVFLFSPDGNLWSNLDIAYYLLEYFQPNEPVFYLVGQTSMLQEIYKEWNFLGMTVKEALQHLISRKRGLGVHLQTDGVTAVYLHIFSLSQQAFTGPAGIDVAANVNQLDVVLDNDLHIKGEFDINSMSAYDQIIVESEENIKLCFSISYAGGSIEEGWTSTEQTSYEGGTDFDRSSDVLARVFTFFRVPNDLDLSSIMPSVDNWGYVSLSPSGAYWLHDMAFLRWLPWLQPSGDPDAEPEHTEPLIWIQIPDSSPAAYIPVDRMDEQGLQHCVPRMADRELGIEIRTTPNHILALNQWDGDGALKAPEVDYTTLVATVNMPIDQKLRIVLPIQNYNFSSPTGRQVFIQIPDVEYWMVAANTVKDIDDAGAFVYNNSAATEVLRDDGDRLRAFAVLAWIWYGQQRAAATFHIENNYPWFGIGNLIRSTISGLSAERIGTVVTEITRNYQLQSQVVKTGYGELDPRGFVREDMGDDAKR